MSSAAVILREALILHQQGNLPRAELQYRAALAQDPHHAQAWHLLGVVLDQMGQTTAAVDSLRQAILYQPSFAYAYEDLGAALFRVGQMDDAQRAYETALSLNPRLVDSTLGLGAIHQTQSRFDSAQQQYERALAIQPDCAAALGNLGVICKERKQFAQARQYFHSALALKPSQAAVHVNLGGILEIEGDLAGAAECYRRAIRLRPDYAQAYNNLGSIERRQCRLAEALQNYDAALRLNPDYPHAHVNRAIANLSVGNFAAGWPEYEWRFQVPDAIQVVCAQPRWQGQPIPGGRVLLIDEQGLGDALQFVRYATLVKQRSGAQVILRCVDPLVRLMAGARDVDEVHGASTPEPACDAYAPLMSLPALCGTLLETVPATVPYLVAESVRVERWRQAFAGLARPRIGIAWQGNPRYPDDASRSIPLAAFAPLAALPECQWVSLQRGFGSEQLAATDKPFEIHELDADLDQDGAFVDTAAVMMNLDLVITSDTAIAHLAGALGVPVWLALAQHPDWRWLLQGDTCPWYPTMRLFRQSSSGNWRAVFDAMAKELSGVIARGLSG